MNATDPWATFRQRWRPYYIIGALLLGSGAIVASGTAPVLQWVFWPLLVAFFVVYWRTTFLECPRCHRPFYWPIRLVWRRCVHCGLRQYARLDEIGARGA